MRHVAVGLGRLCDVSFKCGGELGSSLEQFMCPLTGERSYKNKMAAIPSDVCGNGAFVVWMGALGCLVAR